MIPKIIHFCWLSGDAYPNKIQYCIDSWKEKLPDYEIRLWDLSRFNIDSSIWCKEAFEVKKYAFAADYIRCYALYTEGGIYLDSDVEVLRSFDDLLHLLYFIGEEQGGNIEPAVMGCERGWDFLGRMLSYYEGRHFVTDSGFDMQTLPVIMSEEIRRHYTYTKITNPKEFRMDEKALCVLPAEYFSPKYPNSFKCPVTSRTYAVHHFAASWYSVDKKAFRMVRRLFGYKVAHFFSVLIKKSKAFIFK
ncbi:glycosyltransferase [Phocaeicola salanitronis]|uniref:glycosyltransferase family 32 protein n=1 Tax=Phocaeicola salanitronis TaxID=376805 RepID=UPI0023F9B6BA|nr:glycosyltransferase [Phocaeicola salanitronis]